MFIDIPSRLSLCSYLNLGSWDLIGIKTALINAFIDIQGKHPVCPYLSWWVHCEPRWATVEPFDDGAVLYSMQDWAEPWNSEHCRLALSRMNWMSCLPFLGQFCCHLAKKVYFSVLFCVMSYCILRHFVMCVIALWYAVFCHAVLWCSVFALHCGTCYFVVVCCVAWWYVLLHCCHAALSCSVLFCTVLFTFCTVLFTHCVVLADVWLSCPDPQTSISKRLVFSGASTAVQLQQFVETNIYHRQGMSPSAFVYLFVHACVCACVLCMHVCVHACRYRHPVIHMICPQQWKCTSIWYVTFSFLITYDKSVKKGTSTWYLNFSSLTDMISSQQKKRRRYKHLVCDFQFFKSLW